MSGLHCGSGLSLRPNCVNADRMQLRGADGHGTEPGRLAHCGGTIYYLQHDATQEFPFAAESFAWVFAEHFIEHISLAQAVEWLREMRRLLCSGGIVRISTPDLEKYVRGYLDSQSTFFHEHRRRLNAMGCRRNLLSKAAMLNQIFRFWGHQWVYDRQEIEFVARAAGFRQQDIHHVAFRQGLSPDTAVLDAAIRNDESLYVELVKN